MLQWLLFGGAPLLAAIWVAVGAMRVAEPDRLRAIGTAAAQAGIGLVVFYGLAGSLIIAWLLLSSA